MLSSAEDVGRHNAVDKVIGKLFLNHTLFQAKGLVLSSRISYELVQKAARAEIPIILAVSRPTALAVNLASRLNMTLACLAPKNRTLCFLRRTQTDCLKISESSRTILFSQLTVVREVSQRKSPQRGI